MRMLALFLNDRFHHNENELPPDNVPGSGWRGLLAEPPETHRMCCRRLLDVENFKQINDRYGLLKGDRALRGVTDLLKTVFRSNDLIGRLGGADMALYKSKKMGKNHFCYSEDERL